MVCYCLLVLFDDIACLVIMLVCCVCVMVLVSIVQSETGPGRGGVDKRRGNRCFFCFDDDNKNPTTMKKSPLSVKGDCWNTKQRGIRRVNIKITYGQRDGEEKNYYASGNSVYRKVRTVQQYDSTTYNYELRNYYVPTPRSYYVIPGTIVVQYESEFCLVPTTLKSPSFPKYRTPYVFFFYLFHFLPVLANFTE